MEIMICENMVKTNSSIFGYMLNVNQFAILENTSTSSGQIIIFHQPRFPKNKGISSTKPPFIMRQCEVAIIWADFI